MHFILRALDSVVTVQVQLTAWKTFSVMVHHVLRGTLNTTYYCFLPGYCRTASAEPSTAASGCECRDRRPSLADIQEL